MSIPSDKIPNRLKKPVIEKKNQRSKRWLSVKERELVVEMCRILALKMRITFLAFGDKDKPDPANVFKLVYDHDTRYADSLPISHYRKKAIKFYIHKLKSLKPYSQENLLYNASPYYAAKILDVDPSVIYTVLLQYARTGEIYFKNDAPHYVGVEDRVPEWDAYRKEKFNKIFREAIEPLQESVARGTGTSHKKADTHAVGKRGSVDKNDDPRVSYRPVEELDYTIYERTAVDESDLPPKWARLYPPDPVSKLKNFARRSYINELKVRYGVLLETDQDIQQAIIAAGDSSPYAWPKPVVERDNDGHIKTVGFLEEDGNLISRQ